MIVLLVWSLVMLFSLIEDFICEENSGYNDLISDLIQLKIFYAEKYRPLERYSRDLFRHYIFIQSSHMLYRLHESIVPTFP